MRVFRSIVPWIALTIACVSTGEVSACPNCKEAVSSQEGADPGRLADGYSWSILLMMGMPFTLLGTGSMMVARAVRRGSLPEL